jgi:hypothetical protein
MKTVALWLDIIHIPAALIMCALQFFRKTRTFAAYFWSVVVGMQIACLGCPLSLLTSWMRGEANPYCGFTRYLYVTYGPLVSIPILFVTAGIGMAFTVWRYRSMDE